MTPDLDAIRQRLQKATAGPWQSDGAKWGCFYVLADAGMIADDGENDAHLIARIRGVGAQLPMAANADLIAHAPTDLADLLALADRQQARIAAMEADIKALERIYTYDHVAHQEARAIERIFDTWLHEEKAEP
jgi:hypothetical protein